VEHDLFGKPVATFPDHAQGVLSSETKCNTPADLISAG
jgi:hypothetical protein